ncbi:MAG: hypothetical protein ACI8W8_003899 [Rhodothermales bacterium]|jgi:hypothetical protein
MHIAMTPFAERQYAAEFSGTRVTPEIVASLIQDAQAPYGISPGYADFNQVLAIANTDANGRHCYPLRQCVIFRELARASGASFHSAYEARRPEELAVLTEWVTGVEPPLAPFVHLIIYSRAQLEKEDEPVDADWGIVAINASAGPAVDPMRPITMMRNGLGVEHGGSDVEIDPVAYAASVDFWSRHVMVRRDAP